MPDAVEDGSIPTDATPPLSDHEKEIASQAGDNIIPLLPPAMDESPSESPSLLPGSETEFNQSDSLDLEKQFDREALVNLVSEVRKEAEENRKWYDSRARRMGRISRQLRIAAIALGVLGGLCPLVPANLLQWMGDSADSTISALGFVFFALGGAAVLLDKAFGYSTSWMRSRLAELELSRLIRLFIIETEAALASLPQDNVSGAEAQRMYSQMKAFVLAVGKVITGETETWISEFKSGLLQIEQITKSASSNKGGAKEPA